MVYRMFLALLFCFCLSPMQAAGCNFGLLREYADTFNTRIWDGVSTSPAKVEGYLDFLAEGKYGEVDPAAATATCQRLLADPIFAERPDAAKALQGFSKTCGDIFLQAEHDLKKRQAALMLFTETLRKIDHDLAVLRTAAHVPLPPVSPKATSPLPDAMKGPVVKGVAYTTSTAGLIVTQ